MPPNRRTPSYALHRASGQARVRLSGKEFYLGPYGSAESFERYAALLRQHETSAGIPFSESPLQVLPKRMTVADLVLKFIQYGQQNFYENDGRRTPEVHHFRGILTLLRETFGKLPIGNLSGLHVEELQQRMIAKNWSRGYCNEQLARLRRFIRWSVRKELCPVEVLHKVQTVDGLRAGKTAAREADPVEPISDEVLQATIPQLPPFVRDIVLVMRLTGSRPKEIRELRIGEIDRSGEVWQAKLRRHKNSHRKKLRVLFFGPKAQAILQRYLDGPPEEYVFSPRRSRDEQYKAMRENRKTRVQPSQQDRRNAEPKRKPGEFYRSDSLRRCISRACEVAFDMPEELRNISGKLSAEERRDLALKASAWRKLHCWNPAQLRHSAATEIRKRFGIEAASAVLGHARVETTQIYAAVALEKAAKLASEIG